MTRIRLLALDIDGTLVARENEVTVATRAALERVRAAGIELTLCTGRRYRTTRSVIDALAFELPAVCLGGALVKERDGSTLVARTFPPEDFCALVRAVRESGFVPVAQRDSHGSGGADFLIDGTRSWDRFARAYHKRHAAHAEWCRDLAEEARNDVLVVGAFGEEQPLIELSARLEAGFPGRFRCHVMGADTLRGFYCEIVPREVDKWSGLLALAERRGIPGTAIAAVGDGVNDVSMLRAAAVGVAMGNAHPEARASADWVTGRNDEDGLVAVVDRLLNPASD